MSWTEIRDDKIGGHTYLHLFETLHNHLNAMSDEHDIVGNRFRVWANKTTVQGRQYKTTERQTRLNMRSWLT